MDCSGKRVVLVDLNNFARYPTLSVGLLAAILRSSGFSVRVLSPLAVGVRGMRREPRARPWGLLDQTIRHATAFSRSTRLRRARLALSAARLQIGGRGSRALARQLTDMLPGVDAVLVSTYSTHREVCAVMAQAAARAGVPFLVGGPWFTQRPVVEDWLGVPGIAGIFGGEAEEAIVEVASALCEGRSPAGLPGVSMPGAPPAPPRAPLRSLRALPFPDFDDFPWHRYSSRIVPVIASRGCAWGVCDFCSDVVTSAGRRFRSRPAAAVFAELEHQSARYGSTSFVFTDLKLNSDLALWRALLDFQTRVPGARWIAAVHVGGEEENGLSREELKAARQAGMVRITTGLESGSQRVLDAMRKGTDLERTSTFVRDAWEAGISVRTTMIVGHPAEEPDDLAASAAFLRRHVHYIDRVSLNRLQVMEGTPLHRRLAPSGADPFGGIAATGNLGGRPGHARALFELLRAVHVINRRPLPGTAREFDGVM